MQIRAQALEKPDGTVIEVGERQYRVAAALGRLAVETPAGFDAEVLNTVMYDVVGVEGYGPLIEYPGGHSRAVGLPEEGQLADAAAKIDALTAAVKAGMIDRYQLSPNGPQIKQAERAYRVAQQAEDDLRDREQGQSP